MTTLDDTHNPGLRSWVDSANEPESDFPIQNLPFGRFKVEDDPEWRIGVAIGDQVLDLRVAGLINFSDMNRLIRLKPEARRELRAQISTGLAAGSPQQDRWSQHLHPQGAVELGLPCDIRDYTDFYVGIHHATAVGKLFRPDNPLLPNYKWVPIGYHGRASTIQPSGHSFHRPLGQIKGHDADAPMLAPTRRLDLELELGYVIGRPNAMGHPIPLAEAEDHVFGVTLFNDWSARDFQAWEYQPLGPFLSKNFASTLSPWMVTLEALAPFRQALQRPAGDPAPLPYLQADASQSAGAFDIDLDVLLQTARMRTEGLAPEIISRSNAAQAAYWSLAQLVTHHTVNGCALSAGDLFGSGTLSGPRPEQAGSLLELTVGGKQAITLGNGERRTFLEDGDSITLRGRCTRAGFQSIGFGECTATVLPPLGAI
ncbi:fumarylacetoacetase [Hydrogenophaga taeniospiralis]|uniref:fumarylacetoacetase n=1 Tax=Hydrogenophaga taeniospiralis TaxID=65656 RepID=UPI001CFBC63D|nr:fumarylacetoacetase [Hydrogenophaga taeniospiralis]UCU95653.1 fumarylacetoacetase [Hydrogenophaga taeniospiralis]